jgi:predicted amidohydrolase YtcJ
METEMETGPLERRQMMTLPKQDFEDILERAAERGARHALHGVGLDGADAAHDIRELRNLLDAFNEAKKTAGLTIVKMLVTGLVLALMTGSLIKLKLFGGAQ